MNERESGCQQLATSRERLPADVRTPEPAQTTSMTAASDSSCRQGAADTQTLFFLSVGDEPHEKGLPKLETMTVSSGVKNDPDAEMVSVDQKDPDKVEVKNGWKKFPIQGDPMEDEEGVLSEDNEAINLCSKDILPASPIQNQLAPSPQPGSMLSAKMRLKKQRLEAAQRMSPTWSQQTSANDALRQLAEVAERKQEEEMMEVESSTPQGSPTPAGSPQPLHSPLPTLRMTPYKPTNGLVATRLTPMSEYEVSSSATSLATLTPTASPQMNGRHLFTNHHFPGNKGPGAGQPTPSPDSAIHSAYYSPSQSPVQSRHVSGFSSPFSVRTTPSLSRNNSDASQYGGSVSAGPASTVSDTSPLSPRQFSPTHSPVQSRHPQQQMRSLLPYHHGSVILSRQDDSRSSPMTSVNTDLSLDSGNCNQGDIEEKPHLSAQTGISRQQLINSPCPVCGDKISGFHYGIFSCESCKGFFKRTVQNKKNYVCLRGAQCPVSISTRKKCPACRFDKCLRTGMKLEAIREDRTRGGRSTYQCSYTLPAGVCPSPSSSSSPVPPLSNSTTLLPMGLPSVPLPLQSCTELESNDSTHTMDTCYSDGSESQQLPPIISRLPAKANVPPLLQEIMDVEHLWFSSRPNESAGRHPNPGLNPEENMVQTLADMADKRLYKLVKWCKSLPLFKNILIDDQIALLINAWCELLVFSCCYRSVNSPGSIKVSNEKILTQESAREYGIEKWVEKMLNFSDQMRRLKVDYYEYVSMKVIILLTSDASSLKEAEHVRDSQEKVVQALQQYTYMNSPNLPTKFAELLLRMPELHRVCQVGKEMLCPRQPAENDGSGFNLLLELLRGDH